MHTCKQWVVVGWHYLSIILIACTLINIIMLSSIHIPGVPDIPQIIKVESKEPSVVIVTLQTNQAHIDPTLGSFKFIVKAEPDSSRTSSMLMKSFPVPTYCNGDKVECVVENLLVGGTYTFTASACNEFGESDFCAPKKFTVPGEQEIMKFAINNICRQLCKGVYNST